MMTTLNDDSGALPKKRLPGRPRKSQANRASDMEAEILKSAKMLFRQKGFAAVSMRDVVNEIGISLPTLYYYFEDKEALFAAIVVAMIRNGYSYFADEPTSGHPLDKSLQHLAEGFLSHLPTSLSTIMRDVDEHVSQAHVDKIQQAYNQYLIDPIASLFEAAQAKKQLRTEQTPRELAHLLVCLLDATKVSLTQQYGQSYDPRQYSVQLVDMFLHGVALRSEP